MSTLLKKEQILEIPKLKKTMSVKEIALKFKCAERTIRHWMARLEKEGYKIPKSKGGRKPISLK